MDPVCEEKINFLQKYIPFLANLIDLLGNDSEKEGKLAQMQLLYNLLNKPDNSVKIETLEKCEEVLSRVFGNADEKCNEAEIEETNNQNILLGHNIKVEVENVIENNQSEVFDVRDISEQTNGHTSVEDNGLLALDSSKGNSQDDGPPNIGSKQMTVMDSTSGNEKLPEKQGTPVEIGANNEESEKSPEPHEVPNEIETVDNAVPRINGSGEKNISTDESDKPSSSADINTNSVPTNVEAEPKTQTEQEIQHPIMEPTHESNENKSTTDNEPFILPDDGAENEESLLVEAIRKTPDSPICETNKMEEEKQIDSFIQHPAEVLPFKIISAESLATFSDRNLLDPIVPEKDAEDLIETAKDEKKTHDPLDPLNPINNSIETPIESPIPDEEKPTSVDQKDTRNDNDDEDDDVLLIETRSSPICIDSDPDEEETAKQTNSALASMHKKFITDAHKPPQKPKTSARKSTSMCKASPRYNICNQQTTSIRQTASHRKTKEHSDAGYIVKRDPKLLMETINLIDSDSEEENEKAKTKRLQNDDDVIIVDSSSQPRKVVTKKTGSVVPSHQIKRLTHRPHHKHSPKPPTAQSNFLNAVNLQPNPETLADTASLSTQVSSKGATIPKAIHKSSPYKRRLMPTSTTPPVSKTEPPSNESRLLSNSVPQEQDKPLKDWLECFLTNFASPLQIASHACFVLLQRVLKYRFFQRLKVTRLVLNVRAKNCEPGNMDLQMLLNLRDIFIQDDSITEAGRRFCRFATNDAFGKPVALTTNARTGRVTCRTRIVSSADVPSEVAKSQERATSSTPAAQVASIQKISTSTTTSSPSTPVPSSSTTLASSSTSSKRIKKFRKLSDGVIGEGNDDNDYTPYMGELVLEDEVVSERKKSLRTNRTKRKEAGFTYSEDHDDEEFEALARKIEEKKREELRLAEERELEKEREKERKVKKTVAKKTTSKRQPNIVMVDTGLPKEPVRKKLRLADAEILVTADDDLLTPTWVEADGDDDDCEVDSLLDFTEAPQSPENHIAENETHLAEDDANSSHSTDDHEKCPPYLDIGTNKLLKNTSRDHHTQGENSDLCVHCHKRVPRIVHHYVNEHRSSEVFTSRLRSRSIRRLLTTSNVGFVHLYKGNQQQYAAHCIFCDKEVKFLLPYWFEHFTMHTGEYSFKCSGCCIRKPTRSLLANHLQSGSGCPKNGFAIRLHTFDTKCNQIEAHICSICNYIQLHRKNVLRHLRTQHEIETISSTHIVKVVLLQVSGPYRDEESIKKDESQLSLLQLSDDEDTSINGAPMNSIDGNPLLMQNDFTDNDDLSFMICGMLDVQTNLSASGSALGNDVESNSVDNK